MYSNANFGRILQWKKSLVFSRMLTSKGKVCWMFLYVRGEGRAFGFERAEETHNARYCPFCRDTMMNGHKFGSMTGE